jgi:hypothetical protein
LGCIGIVITENEAKQRKAYIGTVPGNDEDHEPSLLPSAGLQCCRWCWRVF